MILKKTFRISVALLVGALCCSAAVAQKRDAPPVVDGMHLVPDTRFGLVYMDPDADLAVYEKLLLMDALIIRPAIVDLSINSPVR